MHNTCIWNPDQWYEIRGFGTYQYVLVCTGMYWYTIVYMASGIVTCITGTGYLVRTGTYQYVLSTDRYRKSISVQTSTYRYVLGMYQNNVLYVGQQ